MKNKFQSKILITICLVAVVIALWLIMHNAKKGTLVVHDVEKDTVFHVNTYNFFFTSVLKLTLHGNLNDSFEIGGFKRFRGGALDTTIEIDHYTRKFDVKYFHYKATSGNLSIEYYLP